MANKKINQLVSKTSILSTDLFGIGDATTGQLYKKTIAELQAAIGGAVISVNGLVGTVVLDTDDIQELVSPTNKWFTDARARGAISLTVTGNSGASTYSSGTGVLNVPTYTLAGLGGISATFLSGGTGISYNSGTGVISYSGTVYTDSSIRGLISAGTGISYNSSTGAISYSGTVYTDSSIRALISLTTTGSSGASTYNSTTGVINVPNYTLAGLGGISLTSLSGGTGITYNNTTGAISYSGTVYTDASMRALISASGAVSYNNTTGVISLTSGNLTEATSSVLTIMGGTGAVLGSGTTIQVKQASSTVSGFLSSTDWSTFNGKASALSGTTNYHAKFTSSSAIGNSALYEDANGTLGLGVVPSAWGSSSNAIQLKNKLSIFSNSSGLGGIVNNIYSVPGTADYYISTDFASRYYQYQGTHVFETAPSGTAGTSVTLTERMRITSAGNVLINGTTVQNSSTNRGNLTINGTTSILNLSISDTNGGYLYHAGTDMHLDNVKNGNLILYTNDTERMRITSAGELFVLGIINSRGSTDNVTVQNYYRDGTYEFGVQKVAGRGTDLFFTGDSNFNIVKRSTYGSTGGTIYFRVASSGNTLLGTETDNGERLYVSGAIRATGTITANSDSTLKKNLLKIENALEKVEQINGYTYELKEDDSKRHAGVIAQEIQTVLPEIVNKGNDGILGVEYGNISALLIEAIKEQNTKIKNLETLLASK
jgi:hypothetical protein